MYRQEEWHGSDRVKPQYRNKACPSVALSTTNTVGVLGGNLDKHWQPEFCMTESFIEMFHLCSICSWRWFQIQGSLFIFAPVLAIKCIASAHQSSQKHRSLPTESNYLLLFQRGPEIRPVVSKVNCRRTDERHFIISVLRCSWCIKHESTIKPAA